MYEIVKTIHILSAAVLFGTGLGTAWFMWRADRSRQAAVIFVTARHVVWADYLFTLPAILIQPLSGLWLTELAGFPPGGKWLLVTYFLYAIAGACWIPVVWLQIRMRDLVGAAVRDGTALPALYHRYMRIWFILGWPAFTAVIAIFYLMVAKPS
ncbi:MAG TPA: DUF2269 domain-containing protein [Dongiaceae bacterium]